VLSNFHSIIQVLKDAKYLKEAIAAGEVTWIRGLLKKSRGICHGITGNAYGLIFIFLNTNHQKLCPSLFLSVMRFFIFIK
jgi:hypothetical protein